MLLNRFTQKQLNGFRQALENHGTWDYEPGYWTLTDEGDIQKGGPGLHVFFSGDREYDIDTCIDYIGCFTPAD